MTSAERFENLDRRIEAIAMHLELTAAMAHANEARIETPIAVVNKDAENIRTLSRVAELRERRLTDVEGGGRTS